MSCTYSLFQCLEMLECLGIPWVQAAGEAEAMCAYLNASGHVDGCLTNDGDAFLYGAKTVYRNFTMNAKVLFLFLSWSLFIQYIFKEQD